MYPKCHAASGTVSAMTESELAATFTGQRIMRRRVPRGTSGISSAESFSENSISPATAPNESWRLTLAAEYGFAASRMASAVINEVGGSFSRPKIGAMSSIDCMTPARTADWLAPVAATNTHTAMMHSTELLLDFPRASCRILIRNATCIPDMATMCVMPARPIAMYAPASSYSSSLLPMSSDFIKAAASRGNMRSISAHTLRLISCPKLSHAERCADMTSGGVLTLATRKIPFEL